MNNKSSMFIHSILFAILAVMMSGCGLPGLTGGTLSTTLPAASHRSTTAAPRISDTPPVETPTLPPDSYSSTGSAAADSTTGPSETSTSQPANLQISTDLHNAPYIQAALRDLQVRLNVTADLIEVTSVEPVQWSDTSLGCPETGLMYSQVITSGYIVTLQAMGSRFTYHTDTGTQAILCDEEGQPVATDLALPADPDIDDGQPWIPAD